MEVVAHHRIEFRCINDDSIVLPVIVNPVHIYELGEKIQFYNVLTQEGKGDVLNTFEVVEVNQELHDAATGEQVVSVILKKER